MLLKDINKDTRGRIFTVEDDDLGHPEVTFFFTKKGLARGGCIHNKNNEYTTVVSGTVIYQIGDETKILRDGESTIIPKNTPHYFVSITDSVVLEWGATPEEKKAKHKEFRNMVEMINDISDQSEHRQE